MMDWLVPAISAIAAIMAVILVIMGRDRSMIQFIGQSKADALDAVETAKRDFRRFTEDMQKSIHDRIDRVRDEYVRRDDLDGHLERIEKMFDRIETQQEQRCEQHRAELREIKQMINSLFQSRLEDVNEIRQGLRGPAGPGPV